MMNANISMEYFPSIAYWSNGGINVQAEVKELEVVFTVENPAEEAWAWTVCKGYHTVSRYTPNKGWEKNYLYECQFGDVEYSVPAISHLERFEHLPDFIKKMFKVNPENCLYFE